MTTTQKTEIEVFVSYAWGEISPIGDERMRFISELQEAFKRRGIKILIDKNEVTYKKSIKNFMDKIGNGKYVILILSEKYLKSKYCMYEALQILENDNYYDRIFPVVFSDTKIFEPLEVLEYIQFWTDKIKELNEKIVKIDALAYSKPLINELELYFEIRRLLTKFTDVIADLNTLTPEKIKENDFEIIFDSIKNTALSQQGTYLPRKYYVDTVFCIDTHIRAENLELLKCFWLGEGFRLLREKFTSRGKIVDAFRCKLIELNNPDGVNTKFYNLDKQNDLSLFLGKWNALGNSDNPLKDLSSLRKAIQSDWINVDGIARHIIVLFSESSISELDFTDKEISTNLWSSDEYMGRSEKRLALFAPDTMPWNFISENWESVVHYPSDNIDERVYQNEKDISTILEIFANSI